MTCRGEGEISLIQAQVSNTRLAGLMKPRMVVNAAQHTIVYLPTTFLDFLYDYVCHNVSNGWLKTLFFFQCGPETPKGWTPLLEFSRPTFLPREPCPLICLQKSNNNNNS